MNEVVEWQAISCVLSVWVGEMEMALILSYMV